MHHVLGIQRYVAVHIPGSGNDPLFKLTQGELIQENFDDLLKVVRTSRPMSDLVHHLGCKVERAILLKRFAQSTAPNQR